MLRSLLASTAALALVAFPANALAQFAQEGTTTMTTVHEFTDVRPGNPAVAPDGTIYVTISGFSSPDVNLYRLTDAGQLEAFPDKTWAGKAKGQTMVGIASTIGLRVQSDGTVWLLDMGSKTVAPPQPPKLVAWNPDGSLKQVIVFPAPVLRHSSFLQDFVIDEANNQIVVADMTFDAARGVSDYPAFIAVDLMTGLPRRLLERHETLMPSGKPVVVPDGSAADGTVAHAGPDGAPVVHQYGLNPIAIAGDYIYFGTMSGTDVHRIPAEALADPSLTRADLASKIERYGPKPKTDGIAVSEDGTVYVTDVENFAVGACDRETCRTLVRDEERIAWPDGLALEPNGDLLLTANELHNLPGLNVGQDASTPPFYLHRITPK